MTSDLVTKQFQNSKESSRVAFFFDLEECKWHVRWSIADKRTGNIIDMADEAYGSQAQATEAFEAVCKVLE